METVFLRPVTPVYFGRPGALPAGEARSGASWFPPPISAFQGMIRTRLLDEAGVFHPRSQVAELVGEPDSLPRDWQMQGPFPITVESGGRASTWLPAPAFLLKPKGWTPAVPPVPARSMDLRHGTTAGSAELLLDEAARETTGNMPHLLGNPGAGAEKPVGGWMSSQQLFSALKGGEGGLDALWPPPGHGSELPPFVRPEIKIGLAREKPGNNAVFSLSGRAREGMLYSLGTLRFRANSGLVGWFTGRLPAPLDHRALARGRVMAGKKGGIMAFEPPPAEDPHWKRIAAGEHLATGGDEPASEALVWVVLLSSGRWAGATAGREKGDEYAPATAEAMLARAAGLRRVEVLGMLCPGLSWLGGFSLARRRPRPADPWFAPGTSLLVRVAAEEDQDVMKVMRAGWNNRCVLAPEKKRAFGYGHILVAPYHEPQVNKEDSTQIR